MPLTLMEIVYTNWMFGEAFCKLTGILEPTSIFVSTLSITVIAIDRCYIILNPTKASIQAREAILAMVVIWLISILCGVPLYVNRYVFRYISRLLVQAC
jgi:hypothetical protein